MSIFDDAPDEILPVLTSRQARRFHGLLQESFTRHDMTHQWNGDDSYTVDGLTFGLANLAAAVATSLEHERAAAVERHVGLFAEAQEHGLPDVSANMVYPRIRRSRGDQASDYPRRITDDIEVVLAVDYPHVVAEFDSLDELSHLGSADELWQLAFRNLRALPLPAEELIESDGESISSTIHAFQFDDYFGPSRLLLGNEFLCGYLTPNPFGLLVAIPDRHTMLVAAVTDNALLQCGELASITQSLYETSPGATSPSVYHLDTGGDIAEVAYITPDGSTYVRPNPTLSELIVSARQPDTHDRPEMS
jgi:hypothetical protein